MEMKIPFELYYTQSLVRSKYISWRREGRLAHSPFLNKLRQFCLSTPALPYLGIPWPRVKSYFFPMLNIVNSKMKAILAREGFQKNIS